MPFGGVDAHIHTALPRLHDFVSNGPCLLLLLRPARDIAFPSLPRLAFGILRAGRAKRAGSAGRAEVARSMHIWLSAIDVPRCWDAPTCVSRPVDLSRPDHGAAVRDRYCRPRLVSIASANALSSNSWVNSTPSRCSSASSISPSTGE